MPKYAKVENNRSKYIPAISYDFEGGMKVRQHLL